MRYSDQVLIEGALTKGVPEADVLRAATVRITDHPVDTIYSGTYSTPDGPIWPSMLSAWPSIIWHIRGRRATRRTRRWST